MDKHRYEAANLRSFFFDCVFGHCRSLIVKVYKINNINVQIYYKIIKRFISYEFVENIQKIS